MLEVYPKSGECRISAPALAEEGLEHLTWIDLQEPTPEEVSAVEARLGLRVPTREALEEIELSSRLRMDDETLVMSTPLLTRSEDGTLVSAPTGFVLNRRACLTVRFAASAVFETVKTELKAEARATPDDIYARLLEEIVDRAADHFERVADQLDKASHAIFSLGAGKRTGKRQRLAHDTRLLRRVMTEVGSASERISRVRYTLVCVARMAQFAADRGKDWIAPEVMERLTAVKADIVSLEQFDEHMLSRVQLLQDAATAFISIEQNDVVKVLTIASVAGVPPVLVVGLYGMNFKYMPELSWRYGYPYALALMVITTLIPIAWFKWKDWM